MKYKRVKSRSVKPCPYCGKKPDVYVWNMGDGWYDVVIRCKHACYSSMTDNLYQSYMWTVRAWNDRAKVG